MISHTSSPHFASGVSDSLESVGVGSSGSTSELQRQSSHLQSVHQTSPSICSRITQCLDLRACSDKFRQIAEFRPSMGATLSGLGLMTDMYDLSAMNIAMRLLAEKYGDQTPAQAAMMAGSVMVGAVAGQIGFGAAADKIGRRELTFLTAGLTLAGSLGSALAVPFHRQSPEGIYSTISAMRFLLGVGIGGEYPLSASNTVEHSRPKDSGTAIAYIMAILNTGTLLAAGAFAAMIEVAPEKNDLTWRLGLGFGAVLSAVTLGLRTCLLKESPAFAQPARQSLRTSSNELAELVVDGNNEINTISASDNVNTNLSQNPDQTMVSDETRLLNITPAVSANPVSLMDKIRDATANPWFKPLVGTATTWFLYDICTFGIGLYSSQILSEKEDVASAAQSIVMSSALALPFSILAMATMSDKFLGRQNSQLVGTLGMASMLGLMAVSKDMLWSSSGAGISFDSKQHRQIFSALFSAYQCFDAIGPGTSIFAYSSEIFPASVRSTLHGIAAAAGKTGAAVGAMSFPYLKDILGTQGCLLLMNGICAITALVTKTLLPNYTSQHLENIEQHGATASDKDIVAMLYSNNPERFADPEPNIQVAEPTAIDSMEAGNLTGAIRI